MEEKIDFDSCAVLSVYIPFLTGALSSVPELCCPQNLQYFIGVMAVASEIRGSNFVGVSLG